MSRPTTFAASPGRWDKECWGVVAPTRPRPF